MASQIFVINSLAGAGTIPGCGTSEDRDAQTAQFDGNCYRRKHIVERSLRKMCS
jgi:hypothetical protein